MKSRITPKIAIGALVDPVMKFELERSAVRKAALIDPQDDLLTIPFDGKEYIGLLLNSPLASLQELAAAEEKVREKCLTYCPKYPPKQLVIKIFSQVLVH